MHYTAILRQLSFERFCEVLSASSRRAKEGYFARHHIKAPSPSGKTPLGAGHKTQARTEALFRQLGTLGDEPMGEEILRMYLLTLRPLLITTLDHFNIEHEEGLTESPEISRLASLSAIERAELGAVVAAKQAASEDDVTLYLDYMAANVAHEQAAQKHG